MSWLLPAVVINEVCCLILALTYFAIWREEKNAYLRDWLIAWGIYPLRFIATILSIVYGRHPVLSLAEDLITLASTYFLAAGTCRFIGRPFNPAWRLLFAVTALYTMLVPLTGASFMVRTLPAFTAAALIYLWLGVMLLRLPQGNFSAAVTGWAFVLWGIHKADYPFTRELARFAPWGFSLATILTFIVAIGMLLMHYHAAKRTLQQRTTELDTYFNTALDLFCIVDQQGRFMRLNPQWELTLGHPLQELIGRQFMEFVHPDDIRATESAVATLAQDRPVLNFVNRYRHRNGVWRWLEWRSYARDGVIHAAARDVTEREQAEAESRESTRRLNEAQAQAQLGHWELDLRTNRMIWSDEIYRIFGLKPQEFAATYEAFLDVVHPADRDLVNTAYTESVRDRKPYEIVHRLRLRDGTVKHVREQCRTEYDADGTPLRSLGTVQDITARVLAQREQEELRCILESSLNEIYVFDAATLRFEYVSPSALRNLGYTLEQMRAMTPVDIKPRLDQAQFAALIAPLRDGASDMLRFTTEHQRANGSCYPVEVHLQLVAAGGERKFLAMIYDISDRLQAEQAMHDSEERYRGLFRAMTSGFALHEIILDSAGQPCDYRFLEVNPAFEQLTGLKVADLIGRRVREVMPDIEAHWVGTYGKVALGGSPVQFENYAAALDRWYAVSAYSPKSRQFAVIIEDITPRRKMEQDLERQRRLIETMLANLTVGIFMVEAPTGKPLIANDAAKHLLGRGILPDTSRENLGEVYKAFRAADGAPYPVEDMPVIRAMQGEDSTVDDMLVLRPDGTRTHLEVFGTPVRDANGTVIAALVSFHDISARKRAEQELRDKNEELERFTYTVSHDLKSPLTTIKGFAGAIAQDLAAGRSDRVPRDLQRIEAAADKMANLIYDLLELSRIGRIVNRHEAVPFAVLVEEVRALLAGPLAKKQVTLDVAPDLPEVTGDRPRLRSVLQNLVENAVKYMGAQTQPCVRIGWRHRGADIEFHVADNGMGIEPRHHGKIFGLFDKLDPQTEGTGIGLTVVRRIVEAHGGTVRLESAGAGQGCTFYFTLPENPRTEETR